MRWRTLSDFIFHLCFPCTYAHLTVSNMWTVFSTLPTIVARCIFIAIYCKVVFKSIRLQSTCSG
ncbi:uncharacterized protein EDB91DRAFT_1160345 [Suillus paluster]|uniref:uncharacterized protein n=1 Tax=Suillus paluster TaxID=48578 RepID=UPI001B8665CF|nr:uncharacterized protein EDB91DRAFT_1160345 [Suillus paluster]KAG1728966.1 hypothetical protein EDB91DRAFT_1160345 [Suillus paluster]